MTSLYDADSNLTQTLWSGTGMTALSILLGYTADNQVSSATRTVGATTVGTSGYLYNADGLLTDILHQNGSSSTLAHYSYAYNADNLINQITENGTPTNYGFDAANQLTSAGPQNYGYDADGNLLLPGFVIGTGNRLLSCPSGKRVKLDPLKLGWARDGLVRLSCHFRLDVVSQRLKLLPGDESHPVVGEHRRTPVHYLLRRQVALREGLEDHAQAVFDVFGHHAFIAHFDLIASLLHQFQRELHRQPQLPRIG
jgi:hypothetical protein